MLCPVPALKVYLGKTEDKPKNKEFLFISHKVGHKEDLQKNTHFWKPEPMKSVL